MTATKQSSAPEAQETLDKKALIKNQVLLLLGCPPDFKKLIVNHLYGDTYRVNVYVYEGLESSRISDSFFVNVTGAGDLLKADPEIIPRYRR